MKGRSNVKKKISTDWIFDIPNLYNGCNLTASECEAEEFTVSKVFDHSVNATNQIDVKCVQGQRADGLPDWVWYQVMMAL